MDDPVRVLLVGGEQDDRANVGALLERQQRARWTVDWRPDGAAALRALEEQAHDVCLVDSALGETVTLELVRAAAAEQPAVPVIMLAATPEYEIGLEARTLGVRDFLVKPELDPDGLERAIRYAVGHRRAIEALAISEERWSLIVRATTDGIWDWDLRADRLYVSPRWLEILGYERRPGPDSSTAWFELVHEQDLPGLQAAIETHLTGGAALLEQEHRIRDAKGRWRRVLTRGLAIRDEHGDATRIAGSISDVTDRRRAERQLRHDALHDVLTGLPNRALFLDRVEQMLQRGARCAILLLDLDRFKLINDSLSHSIGDELLLEVSDRLSGLLRLGETVARVGGDEFMLVLDGVPDDEQATLVAQRVQDALRAPFYIDERQLFISASIGVALGDQSSTAVELLRNAGIAMYQAKRRGQATFSVFDESMHRQAVARLTRETELRDAVERSLMPIYYQPIIDLGTGAIGAFEALARWPRGGPQVAPREFIPLAEETGMIGTLGLHVLRGALATLAQWRADELVGDDVYMSVNVSCRQLEEPRLPQQIQGAINDAGVSPQVLRLEVTESTLMHEPDAIAAIVAEVCAAGVGLQLDDFGTGYSSLAALHQFPFDALKIDRSFVAAAREVQDDSEVIVRSTIALAHSLRLHVIAEGIEESEQFSRLRTLGCEYGQGYLFSRPLDAEQTRELLAAWSPADVAGLGTRAS